MFTGVVQAVSSITKAEDCKKEIKIQVLRPKNQAFKKLKAGDSIAVSGLCLTLERITPRVMHFHLGQETLKIMQWKKVQDLKGRLVNLEAPLRWGDFIGGHFMSGHVNGLVRILSCKKQPGGSCVLKISLPKIKKKCFLWKKAFIALDGVSLTVNSLDKTGFFVCLVPKTLKNSTFSAKKTGDKLAFELDYGSVRQIYHS